MLSLLIPKMFEPLRFDCILPPLETIFMKRQNLSYNLLQLSVLTHIPGRLLKIEKKIISLIVLRFYGPVNPMGSCRARSVYLTTRLLGRLSLLSG